MKRLVNQPRFYLLIMVAIIGVTFYCCKKSTGSGNSNSNIIYTDLTPDSIISRGYGYNLDLNKDGNTDFIFSVYSQRCNVACGTGITGHIAVYPATGSTNEIELDGTSGNYPRALDLSSVIDSASINWSANNSPLLLSALTCNSCKIGHYQGNWPLFTDKYLGLKFAVGTKVYYGWVRLNMSVGEQNVLIIKDFAYNSTSGQSIMAGQMK